MPKMTPLTVHVADLPEVKATFARLTAERDGARDLAATLEAGIDRLASAAFREAARLTAERDEAMKEATTAQAELETALRNLDAARGEIARLSASEASAAASARQNTAGLR